MLAHRVVVEEEARRGAEPFGGVKNCGDRVAVWSADGVAGTAEVRADDRPSTLLATATGAVLGSNRDLRSLSELTDMVVTTGRVVGGGGGGGRWPAPPVVVVGVT